MAAMCKNSIKLYKTSGNEKLISDFMKAFSGQDLKIFDNHHPAPQAASEEMLLDWQLENWGCHANPSKIKIVRITYKEVTFSFETPDAPVAFFENYALEREDSSGQLQYVDNARLFEGECMWVDGSWKNLDNTMAAGAGLMLKTKPAK